MSKSQFFGATKGPCPFILICLGMLWSIHAFGQQAITGQVIDGQTGQPIGQVNVLAIQEQKGTSTDQEGRFRLMINSFPVTLQFSHIAYQPDSMNLPQDPGKSVQIKMNPRTEAIGEVVIEGGKYQQLMRREEFYVLDYEFDSDKIWVLGYAGKSILNPQLVVLNLGGLVLDRISAGRETGFYKDAFDQVYLEGKDYLSTVDYKDGDILIGNRHGFAGWEQNLFDLQLVLGHYGIFRWSYNNGLLQEFAVVDFSDTTATVVHKSYDRERFRGDTQARSFRHSRIPDINMGSFGMGGSRSDASFDPSDAFTARAQEQLDYRPVQARIFRFRNHYLIFEDRGCHLWKYTLSFLDPEDLQISLPDQAKNPDMLQDPVTGRFFLHYTISGSDYLAYVNPQSGQVENTHHLDGFHSVENLRVYDDRIWFTHQGMSGNALMNLYSAEVKK